MDPLVILIEGTPVPQGSKTAYVVNGRAVLTEASKKLKPWRKHVTETATQTAYVKKWLTISTACTVDMTFLFERPKSAKSREYPSVKPDLDKLARAVLDGLSDANIWNDDAQVVTLRARKRYVEANPCAVVTVIPLGDDQ